jgi:(2Fe-2S) ferredoxin
MDDTVKDRAECQSKCGDGCAGVAYSDKEELSQYCYICKNGELIPSANDFHFYRKVDRKVVKTTEAPKDTEKELESTSTAAAEKEEKEEEASTTTAEQDEEEEDESSTAAAADEDSGLWPVDSLNQFCKEREIDQTVNDRLECQTKCGDGCVGIAYSDKEELSQYCYICHDDTLIPSSNDFHFYAKAAAPEDDIKLGAARAKEASRGDKNKKEKKEDSKGEKKDTTSSQHNKAEKAKGKPKDDKKEDTKAKEEKPVKESKSKKAQEEEDEKIDMELEEEIPEEEQAIR